MKNFTFILLFMLLVSTFSFAGDSDQTTDYSEVITKMETYIENLLDEHKVASLSIALVDGQDTVWKQSFGYADVNKEIKATEKTIYNMGSISKLFTGMAIMQLVEEGKIDLDAPLSTYLPEFSIKSRFDDADANNVTIRGILTHHSGLPSDYLHGLIGRESDSWEEKSKAYEKSLYEYLNNTYMAHPNDYIFSYSNIGYNLLAYVIRNMTGKTAADYVQENILLPLGMDNASFLPYTLRDDIGDLMAEPHSALERADKYLWMIPGAGALNAPVPEMANFIKMILAKGTYGENQVVSEETLSRMLTQQNDNIPLDGNMSIGLSFSIKDPTMEYAGKYCGHNGGMIRHFSELKVLLDHDLGVVLAVNSDTGEPIVREIALTVLKEALEAKTGLTQPVPEPEAEEIVTLSEDELKDLEGDYSTLYFRLIKIKVKNNRIKANFRGLNFELKPLKDGWLKPVTFNKHIKDFRIKIQKIDDKKILFFKPVPHIYHALGIESDTQKPGSIWKERTGTYIITNAQDDPFPFFKPPITFKIKKDTPLLITKNKIPLFLVVVNDNECITGGIGRSAGETILFKKENGKDVIYWSGYRLEKK